MRCDSVSVTKNPQLFELILPTFSSSNTSTTQRLHNANMGRPIKPVPVQWGKYNRVLPRVSTRTGRVQSSRKRHSVSVDHVEHQTYHARNVELQQQVRRLEGVIQELVCCSSRRGIIDILDILTGGSAPGHRYGRGIGSIE